MRERRWRVSENVMVTMRRIKGILESIAEKAEGRKV